jgi:toxin ParE1/3/4
LSETSIIVSRRALNDLEVIIRRIAADSPATARNIKNEIQTRFEDAARAGLKLRERTEFGIGVRVLQHKPWMIFFRVENQNVHILRVLHGAMHPKRLSAAAKSSSS